MREALAKICESQVQFTRKIFKQRGTRQQMPLVWMVHQKLILHRIR